MAEIGQRLGKVFGHSHKASEPTYDTSGFHDTSGLNTLTQLCVLQVLMT